MSGNGGRWTLLVLLTILLLPACRRWTAAPTPTPVPTATPTPPPMPTPEPPDTGWRAVADGVEVRRIRVAVDSGMVERVTLVRLDPGRIRFSVLYTPGEGRRVSEWATLLEESGHHPLMVANGGFFTPEYTAAGLLVSRGQVYGTSYEGFGGMLAVLPGGRVEVRWLVAQPYEPGEWLVEGVQGFPMLVRPDGTIFPPDADDGRTARRTVVAQERDGRIVFLVAQDGFFSLHNFARWLATSDLSVVAALNLDGGQSSGLYLRADSAPVQINSGVGVPAVIVAEVRR